MLVRTLHRGQTVCMLSASQPLCTIQQNIQKTKGSTEGENEETDQTINSTTRDRVWLCVCASVCVKCVHVYRRGRQKERGGRGRWRQMQRGKETEGGGENERQREKSNLQEHNKKLYLRQKRTHKGICLAVCTSRILWKFIKLEPFKRRQRVVNYTTGEEKSEGEGMGGWKGRKS